VPWLNTLVSVRTTQASVASEHYDVVNESCCPVVAKHDNQGNQKSMKSKFSAFFKFIKLPQTKLNADTMSDSKLTWSKKVNLSLGQKLLQQLFFSLSLVN